jgi:acyl-CoA synthetase (AMP-forming)/AMP-acid ligase II
VITRTFDPKETLTLIETHRVTEMWLPPTALYLLLDYPDRQRYDLSSLRCVLLGMAGVAAERIRQAIEAFGPCLMHSYGQIETGFVTMLDSATIADAAAGRHEERLRSSGRTVDLNRFAVMDDDDQLVPPGGVGEIVVRGAGVKRYLDPALTAAAQRSGWHRTGDVGYVDPDGFLYITGRIKDVVNMAGFKISAAEVEGAVRELEEVHDCAVVPAPDPVRGEVIVAVVATRPGRTITEASVISHCRRRLGVGKTPRIVAVWPELPRSPAGKVDKARIRAAFANPSPAAGAPSLARSGA